MSKKFAAFFTAFIERFWKLYCTWHAQRFICELSLLCLLEEGQMCLGPSRRQSMVFWFCCLIPKALVQLRVPRNNQAVWNLKNWCCNISDLFSPTWCDFNSTNSFFWGERKTFEIGAGQNILLSAPSCCTWREELVKEKEEMLSYAPYL